MRNNSNSVKGMKNKVNTVLQCMYKEKCQLYYLIVCQLYYLIVYMYRKNTSNKDVVYEIVGLADSGFST